ncbi:hypothetical protein LPJ59_001115 [Coemansia sp. RSA 2399]|nr:hypothetical protein LPJ59_001115 [Coemansia sp. RSA 2399]KAJ1907150.1 hypothetical protein LPJ81_000939 [Coemansia sp. IMI 209127]
MPIYSRFFHAHLAAAKPEPTPLVADRTNEPVPVTGPPTPNSFNDPSNGQSVSGGQVFDVASASPDNEQPLSSAVQPASKSAVAQLGNGTTEEFMQTDSPVFAHFDDQTIHRGDVSPMVYQMVVDSTLPAEPQVRPTASLRNSHSHNANSEAANPAAHVNRYSSMRLRERPANGSTGVTNGLRASVFSSSFSPIHPEVALMLDQINEHRKEAAELAKNTGVMSDKYHQCLQGYTSIQEPTSAFWKRRYFVVADNTMFLYTNECSRVPSDYLEIGSVVHSPRDAEDEVLMPHSLAVDFGSGDCYMYFDTSDMMRAFEGEISKAIEAA